MNVARPAGISLVAHCAAAVLFSFSLGISTRPFPYPGVLYVGKVAHAPITWVRQGLLPRVYLRRPDAPVPSEKVAVPAGYAKPAHALPVLGDKVPAYVSTVPAALPPRPDSSVMLYPQLPPGFLLYFSDRQKVHIELSFMISRTFSSVPELVLQRRISSGNLEADLLCMRHISRYLFMRKDRFVPEQWRTIKIDLSLRPQNVRQAQ
jgi:hypothetical protein